MLRKYAWLATGERFDKATYERIGGGQWPQALAASYRDFFPQPIPPGDAIDSKASSA